MSRKKMKLAVVYGGISNERDVSILSAGNIIQTLSQEKYDISPIEVMPNGAWKLQDKRRAKILTVFDNRGGLIRSDIKQFDLVYIALHGEYGEDGTVQAILDALKVPYTGSGTMASAIGMNKIMSLELARAAGLTTPRFIEIDRVHKRLPLVAKEIGFPCVVKPNAAGSSVGITIVKKRADLKKSVQDAFKEDTRVLVEEYIVGRELTCGALGNSGTTTVYAMPPIEILPQETFYDFHAKYTSDETAYDCPAGISKALTKKILHDTVVIHEVLECRGMTRSDFILKNNKLYFLEINTLPGMTSHSLCPKSANVMGLSFEKLLDLQIKLARMS